MSDRNELVWRYVSESEITDQLTSAHITLNPNELQVAVRAIQGERAQWAVDNALLELLHRTTELETEKQQLEARIEEISLEIGSIALVIGGQTEITAIDSMEDRVQHRINQYNKKPSNALELHEQLSREKPLELSLDAYSRPNYNEDGQTRILIPSLRPWAIANEGLIEATFGKKIRLSALRVSYKLENLMWNFGRDADSSTYEYADLKFMSQFVRERADGGYLLQIDDPEIFLGRLLQLRGVAYSQMIALLCIADLQQDQNKTRK